MSLQLEMDSINENNRISDFRVENRDVLDFIRSLGVGCRHPKDEFFREGNELNKVHKIFGVLEVDEEEFHHKSYSQFSCHIPGCSVVCETVYEYDQHYNSCHRFSCIRCKKYLPSSHLLDLHIMETHDAYFMALSEKKPMFQCYLQECDKVFQTPQQRREHCIKDHKFPSNFRFDGENQRRANRKPKSKKKAKNKSGDVEMVECDDDSKMEISNEEEEKGKANKGRVEPVQKKNVSLGCKRRPILDMKCFVKDLKESLPS